VLLVAPPYVSPLVPPADTPPGISSFFPPQLSADCIRKAARETTIIAGEGDCYGTEDQIKAYSDRLNIPMYTLQAAGHVSPYWGYGAWPWVRDWALGKVGFPPQTNG
jgi:Acetolactate synthase